MVTGVAFITVPKGCGGFTRPLGQNTPPSATHCPAPTHPCQSSSLTPTSQTSVKTLCDGLISSGKSEWRMRKGRKREERRRWEKRWRVERESRRWGSRSCVLIVYQQTHFYCDVFSARLLVVPDLTSTLLYFFPFLGWLIQVVRSSSPSWPSPLPFLHRLLLLSFSLPCSLSFLSSLALTWSPQCSSRLGATACHGCAWRTETGDDERRTR